MTGTEVDRIYREYSAASEYLFSNGEISLSSALDSNSSKAVLMAAASYFERRLTDDLLNLCRELAGQNPLLPEIVKNKAIARQYHTWFSWDKRNANTFFIMFGTQFKDYMDKRIKSDEGLDRSIVDFLEIGRERNRLVHENFATFELTKTVEEIHTSYLSALNFVNLVPIEMRKFSLGISARQNAETTADRAAPATRK